MAMSKSTNTYNRQNWEDSVSFGNKLILRRYYNRSLLIVNNVGFSLQDFPILCQTCLGDNPYIRMVMCYLLDEIFLTLRERKVTI